MNVDDLGLQIIQDNLRVICESCDIYTVIRTKFWIFKKSVQVNDICTGFALWVVAFKSNLCIDHDHVTMVCTRHKDDFINKKFEKIRCFEGQDIANIEKFEILSVSAM